MGFARRLLPGRLHRENGTRKAVRQPLSNLFVIGLRFWSRKETIERNIALTLKSCNTIFASSLAGRKNRFWSHESSRLGAFRVSGVLTPRPAVQHEPERSAASQCRRCQARNETTASGYTSIPGIRALSLSALTTAPSFCSSTQRYSRGISASFVMRNFHCCRLDLP